MPLIGIAYGSRLNIQCSQEYLRTSFHLYAAESVQNRDAHVNLELQSSAEKNDFHISNQYLSSATWRVVTQSPEPKAHVTNVRAFWVELEFRNVGFFRKGENRSTRRKTSRSREENQQQTRPTWNPESGNRTPGHIGAWEASALTTTGTPSLLPYNEHQLVTSTDYHELTYRQGPVVQSLDLSWGKITIHWTSTIKTYWVIQ